MKILFVYPKSRDTFWSLRHSLKFVLKKAVNPPLGLLTVASILPEEWEKKLVDMNITHLKDSDLKWADFVFISAISIQRKSVREVIARCKKIGVKTVAGGPLFTTEYDQFDDVDHLVLNEAEVTLPRFLEDLKNGSPKHIYTSEEKPDIRYTPAPLWKLIKMRKYATMNIQYSRGCPFNCEFCDITLLYGHKPRTKDKEQIISELENLYSYGWRDRVFFVDDNFIGNKIKLKREILPAIIRWMEKRRYPFSFITQVSIELSDDKELMELMVKAGFNTVFVGIETFNEESLTECTKMQNKNRDLVACVKKMQRFGIQVWGGFIVGFDSDPVTIFEKQIEFIQKTGIVTAMVSLLNALKGTRLYHRLERENRLLDDTSGDNTDCSVNFIPNMNYDTLINGYKKILSTIYSPVNYYARVREFLKEYRPVQSTMYRFRVRYLWAFFRSTLCLGIIERERVQYWKILFWTLFRCPRLFPFAVNFAIYGFHFRRIFGKGI